jgi:uncharacterized protein (DUF58 family)
MNEETLRRYLVEGESIGARYSLAGVRTLSRGRTGFRLGSGVGSSQEFLDHREYYPGDDVRRIDWSAFARSDRLILKLYREEISPHLDIILDGSCSMVLDETSKGQAGIGVTALLAQAAENSGFSHGLWLSDTDGCRRIENGHERPSRWQGLSFSSRVSPTAAFGVMPPALKPFGIRLFISDLLWPGDPLALMRVLADRASLVILVQVLAESDIRPLVLGNLQLVDSETSDGMNVFVDERTVEQYVQAFSRHQENWRQAARQAGAVMTTIVAERLADTWHLDDLLAQGILELKA